jgi:hypothetical protein
MNKVAACALFYWPSRLLTGKRSRLRAYEIIL